MSEHFSVITNMWSNELAGDRSDEAPIIFSLKSDLIIVFLRPLVKALVHFFVALKSTKTHFKNKKYVILILHNFIFSFLFKQFAQVDY